MSDVTDWWNGLHEVVRTLIAVAALTLGAGFGERVLSALLRRAYLRRLDEAAASLGAEELARINRQRTLGSLLESLIRYAVYGAAIIVAVAIVGGGREYAVQGASLVVLLVGFSLQRIFADIIAGAMLLFEGEFAIGDVITVHHDGGTGVVEEFSLRTTFLRTMAGDRIAIPNGGVAPFTRWDGGVRPVRLELLVRSLEAADTVRDVCRAEAHASTMLWASPPVVELVEPVEVAGQSLHRVVVVAQIVPGLDQQAEHLAGLVRDVLQGRDLLVGPVTRSMLHSASLEAWRGALPAV